METKENGDKIDENLSGGAQKMFSRNKQDANLEDFKIVKLIGKGTFGKVYLVEHQSSKKLFAMKCIRKDIILEND